MPKTAYTVLIRLTHFIRIENFHNLFRIETGEDENF